MKPVVLIQRNLTGGAFVYKRFNEYQEVTDHVELLEVPIGDKLPCLSPEHVELFRTDPKKIQ